MKFWIIFTICYMLPSIIAIARSVSARVAIVLFNFLLGWTIVGWCIAMLGAIDLRRDFE